MWKFQWSFKQGSLVIQFVHGRTSYDTAVMLFRRGGEGLRAKQFMMFSVLVCVKHKRDKKNFLHIDLTYYQGNKTCIHNQ